MSKNGLICKILLLAVFLFLPISALAALAGDNFAVYDHDKQICQMMTATANSETLTDGWQQAAGRLVYYQNCQNQSEAGCCGQVCQTYTGKTNQCHLQPELLQSLHESKKFSEQAVEQTVYVAIILVVIIATYLIVGIVSVIYFVIRG